MPSKNELNEKKGHFILEIQTEIARSGGKNRQDAGQWQQNKGNRERLSPGVKFIQSSKDSGWSAQRNV